MEELLEILQDIDDSVDYESETKLIDDHILEQSSLMTTFLTLSGSSR